MHKGFDLGLESMKSYAKQVPLVDHILGSVQKHSTQRVKRYEKFDGVHFTTTVSASLENNGFSLLLQSCTHLVNTLTVFALVTDTGHLIVYNINHPGKPWEKIAAHGAEASTLDWHPTRPYIIATGGVADRSVKSTHVE